VHGDETTVDMERCQHCCPGLRPDLSADTIASLDEEIRRTQDYLQNLLSRRRTLLPIFCLPLEIVGLVFDIVKRDCVPQKWPRQLMNLSQTCHVWRAAAHSRRTLWTTINCRYPSLAKHSLEYAKPLPVNVVLNQISPAGVPGLDAALDLLPGSRSLDLVCPAKAAGAISKCLKNASSRAPFLQTLRLELEYKESGRHIPIPMPDVICAPNLICFSLKNAHFVWESCRSDLRALVLKSHTLPDDWTTLRDILSNLQQLEILSLDYSLPEEAPKAPPTSLIALPNLRYLDIEDYSWEGVEFFEGFSLGPCTRVVYTNSYNFDTDQLARMVRLLVTRLRSSGAPPVSTLFIQVFETEVTFVGWGNGDALSAPAVQIQIQGLLVPDQAYQAIDIALQYLGQEVQNLKLEFTDVLNGAELMSLFTLPHVHMVAIADCAVTVIMDFLASRVEEEDANVIWPRISHMDLTQGCQDESDMRLVETALRTLNSLTGRRLARLSLRDGDDVASDVADVVVHSAPPLEDICTTKEWDVDVQVLIDQLVHGEHSRSHLSIAHSKYHNRHTVTQTMYSCDIGQRDVNLQLRLYAGSECPGTIRRNRLRTCLFQPLPRIYCTTFEGSLMGELHRRVTSLLPIILLTWCNPLLYMVDMSGNEML
jgi:hypothetical protein